jgi:cytochrome c oxidase cbb3-type subunit 1
MCYTAVSFQGSAESLRTMQETVHFTHYTIGHAHLGVYAFLTSLLFGAMYYITPRVARGYWHRPRAINLHFWITAVGILLYFVALTIGGWLQGREMHFTAAPFVESVRITRPWLHARTVSGILLTVGHLLFAFLFFELLLRPRARREEAA